ncbi:hypothetical protein NliqN6_1454 [Naganishia liquefaciens]|uniref:Uncharacterized protein n=1 Tax=Naganishia liquefaciens TaxID=104408 RepID=A0A8H3TPW8_9TREE|nr:hypothetical protein NliqN6_1454 [Naganishia liquefaciens]
MEMAQPSSEEFLLLMAINAATGSYPGAIGEWLVQGYISDLALRYNQLRAPAWERLTVTTGLIAVTIGAALICYFYYQQTVVHYAGQEKMEFYP